VNPSDFFRSQPDETRGGTHGVFDAALISAITKGPIDNADDLGVAQGLANLVYEELKTFGTTSSDPKLDDREIANAIKALRAVLGRLGIAFNPPFRDFTGFRDYWIGEGMKGEGGYAKRRRYLRELFEPVLNRLDELADTGSSTRGVDGQLKNIIFAGSGPKPKIVLRDAVNNVIDIVENAEYCLVYDRPLTNAGLRWQDLVEWWGDRTSQSIFEVATEHDLLRRLDQSLDNEAERILFRTYCERYRSGKNRFSIPALLPQVYLHFDPLTRTQRRALRRPDYLSRERMDFLLLLPNGVRIVLEVDGKQHYADDDRASPQRYAEMVAEDRALRLLGYEVFRFGGYELLQPNAVAVLRKFFGDLFTVHGIEE
jgi:hypothetical protein